MSIRILLADDHRIMRDGLRSLLKGEPDMEVIAESDNGRATVKLARELAPHVVIMDITMPELNGIEATRRILEHCPTTQVVVLSLHSDRRLVTGALKAGASAYLLKDCAFEELTGAIRAVVANQTYLCPGITRIVIEDYLRHSQAPNSSAFSALTPREREVAQLLSEGKTTKQIALFLSISVKTV